MTQPILDRRELLRAGALLGAAPAWLRPLERAARMKDRVVVCIELHGGNDGLNTLAPTADDAYHRARPDLGLRKGAEVRPDEHHVWHPSLSRLARRFAEGGVACVQGVGYPRPNLSHFTSLDVWHAGTRDWPAPATGWIGRAAGHLMGDGEIDPLFSLALGHDVAPHALRAERGHAVAVPSLADLEVKTAPMRAGEDEARARRRALERLEAASLSGSGRDARIAAAARAARQVALDLARARDFDARVDWPAGRLAQNLNLAARIISRGLPTRFFFVSQSGYDTHAIQAAPHARLLAEFDAALDAFLSELEARDLAERVLVVTISDFGRRVAQNGKGQDAGTDHGAASLQFLLGAGVEPGIHGPPADLEDVDEHGNLRYRVDFREVIGAVSERWLGVPAQHVVGEGFAPHPCVRG